MVGISNFSSRFEYSGHLQLFVKHLPPCESSLQQMMENSLFLKSNVLCEKCVNWNMIIDIPLMLFDAPKNYSKCMLPDDRKLKPKETSFEI